MTSSSSSSSSGAAGRKVAKVMQLSGNILSLEQAVSKNVQIYVNEMSSFGYEENAQGAKSCSYLFHLKYVQNSRPCNLIVRFPWAIVSECKIPDTTKFDVKKANLLLNFKNHEYPDLVNNGEKYLQWIHLLTDNVKSAVQNYLGDEKISNKQLQTREGNLIQEIFNFTKHGDMMNGFIYDDIFEQDPLDIIQEYPTCVKIKPLLRLTPNKKTGKVPKFTEFFHSQKKKDNSGGYYPEDAIAEDLVELSKNPDFYNLASAVISVENVCIMMQAKTGQYYAYIGLVVEQVHYCHTGFAKPQIVIHKEGSQEPYNTLEGVGSPLHQNFYSELNTGPIITPALPFKPASPILPKTVMKVRDSKKKSEEEEENDDEDSTQMDN